MMDNRYFIPNSPGVVVAESLELMGKTPMWLSEQLNLDFRTILNLIGGKYKVTKHLATKLSNTLGGTPEYWLKLEKKYREQIDSWQNENLY